jgi:AhpD family alkylhydroperoxidase
MKIKARIMNNNGDNGTATLLTSEFIPTSEFEHLYDWVRLGASNVRKNLACIEVHRQRLRAQGETEMRLDEFDHWRQSVAFTDREKAALNLSETISLDEDEEVSTLILKHARSYFSTHQIVRLMLTVVAVNEWIDLQSPF